jgi:hypothetical protein
MVYSYGAAQQKNSLKDFKGFLYIEIKMVKTITVLFPIKRGA